MLRTSSTRAGFTLIELIIYIGITTIVVVSLTRVMLTIFETRARTETVSALQQNMRFVMDRMANTIVDASSIDWDASIVGKNEGALRLTLSGSSITFALRNGTITTEEGKAAPVALTASGITIETLKFRNVSGPNGIDTVSIELHGRGLRSDASPDTMTLTTSVSLRQ